MGKGGGRGHLPGYLDGYGQAKSGKRKQKRRKKDKEKGYEKPTFCGEQAARDGLQYFWVDTCFSIFENVSFWLQA